MLQYEEGWSGIVRRDEGIYGNCSYWYYQSHDAVVHVATYQVQPLVNLVDLIGTLSRFSPYMSQDNMWGKRMEALLIVAPPPSRNCMSVVRT